MKYIASCSFGKDSIATILLAIENNEPLDGAVFSEVMFDLKRNIVTQYVGIAADEPRRLARLKSNQISLLDKYGYTEEMAMAKCKEYGLVSPIYESSHRGGVGFVLIAKSRCSQPFAKRIRNCGKS